MECERVAAFLTQTVGLDDGLTVKFEIWDTAGQGAVVHVATSDASKSEELT